MNIGAARMIFLDIAESGNTTYNKVKCSIYFPLEFKSLYINRAPVASKYEVFFLWKEMTELPTIQYQMDGICAGQRWKGVTTSLKLVKPYKALSEFNDKATVSKVAVLPYLNGHSFIWNIPTG